VQVNLNRQSQGSVEGVMANGQLSFQITLK
jgi:hypothetical protein